MVDFWFVRHGESMGNAGLPVESDERNFLTDKGKLQAKYVADYITSPPDLFVLSPYIRTAQTARPTINKFPHVPVETWAIQEYSYLTPKQYAGTTSRQRRKLSQNYFKKADPDLILGPGAESFNQFIERIENCFQKISSSNHNFIILFGHGWFMRAALWYIYTTKRSSKQQGEWIAQIREHVPNSKFLLNSFHKVNKHFTKNMFHFLLFSIAVRTPNTGILKFHMNQSTNEIRIIDFSLDHLAKHLQKTTLSNR